MAGADVTYTTRAGEQFGGYLTGPDTREPAPGILIISSIFGVDDEMRELADEWARDGFIVSAPDIFWRQLPGPTADRAVAMERNRQFDPEQGMRDIEDLIADLKARPQCNGKVGIIGFCFGGRYALLAAARLGVHAAAAFHGTNMGEHLDEVSRIGVPVSYHFGADDPVVPIEEVRAIQQAFAGKPNAEICVYEGAGHSFAMPKKQGHHPQVAEESRRAALACMRSM